jgi:tetratricopeptide (TPR) repeat protein
MSSKLLNWILNLPKVLKVLIGLLSTVIPVLILLRGNVELSIVVILAIVVFATFSSLAYIAVAKDDPIVGFSTHRASLYKYPRYRQLAKAGLCILAIVCILIFGLKSTRNYILAALKGKKVAPHADILIAEFDAKHASKKYEIANRIRRNLETQLAEYNLASTRVETLSVPIDTAQDAKTAMEQSGCRVLVWGWYDDLGSTVNISTSESFSNDNALRMKEVAWAKDSPVSNDISMSIRERLPEDITFLSLVIIGTIAYQRNNYQQGHRAFDAAMGNLPKEIGLENASVLHFFSARSLEALGNHDVERVICEYSKAIELDANAFAAYNNLGIVTANLYIAYDKQYRGWMDDPPPTFQFPGKSSECLASIGSQGYADLFDRALELQPNSSFVRYNKLATEWLLERNEFIHGYDVEATLDEIIRTDPAIPGAHILRGVLAFDKGELFQSRWAYTPFTDTDVNDNAKAKTLNLRTALALSQSLPLDDARFQVALREFSAASALLPKSFELHINLGKVYMRRGMYAEGRSAFENALLLNPGNSEAKLALADVAIKERRPELALQYLDGIKLEESGTGGEQKEEKSASVLFDDMVQMAAILKSRIFFDSGDSDAAIEALRSYFQKMVIQEKDQTNAQKLCDAPLTNYLLVLLQAFSSNGPFDKNQWKECVPLDTVLDTDARLARDNSYQYNGTTDLAWNDVNTLCGATDPSLWGETSECLPRDLGQRLRKVFDIAQGRIAYRIYFRQESRLAPAFCPYVFTYDTNQRQWIFDTSILTGLDALELAGSQLRPLRRFDGRLIVSEVEPEISHLDQIRVVVVGHDGKRHILRPRFNALREIDNNYLVLHQGDELYLTFDNLDHFKGLSKYWIEATGYYTPVNRSTVSQRPRFTTRQE